MEKLTNTLQCVPESCRQEFNHMQILRKCWVHAKCSSVKGNLAKATDSSVKNCLGDETILIK